MTPPTGEAGGAGWISRGDRPPRCLSPHVSPPTSHCERLNWTAPDRWLFDGRVLRWTCDCTGSFYELRQAGGLRFIRWTLREQETDVIRVSDPWPAKVADAQWTALLMGHLR
ncbi:hypothetical protein ACFOY2_11340 [Nonomuraea purpurea]|uniref:Uncharacterized protein n=1 Tax=Nonomuraea purpurea TaxID=1849276 RepID=A0ABV8G1E8_9ACTN